MGLKDIVKEFLVTEDMFRELELRSELLQCESDDLFESLFTDESIKAGKTRVDIFLAAYIGNEKNSVKRSTIAASLMSFAESRNSNIVRRCALNALEAMGPASFEVPLISIARSEGEPIEIRSLVLQVLSKIQLAEISISQLLEVLGRLPYSDDYTPLCVEMIRALKNCGPSQFDQCRIRVERFLNDSRPEVVAQAIRTLGRIGEIDVLERVCLLSTDSPDVREATHNLLDDLLNRPKSLRRIRWQNFEKVVERVVKTLPGVHDAETTNEGPDGGVDLFVTREIGMSREVKRGVVQCKRYSNKTKVNEKDVKDLHCAFKANDAKWGAIVTTSRFTEAAKNVAEELQIELIDDGQLLKLVESAYGPNVYCI